LYYAGWSVPDVDGHAFICDAYQVDSNNNYYYHFNFGWDGSMDGYFTINPLKPGNYNFDLAQELIINAYPNTINPPLLTGTTILTTETGSFTHGTIYDCPPNMDYTWIIRPDADDIEKIQFDIQYKLAKNDTLFVASLNGSVNRVFTYDTSNFSADIIDTEVIVRLKTTNQLDSSGGISANYTTKRPVYCVEKPMLLYETKQGTIDDGSGNSRYNNFTNCTYGTYVKGSHSITITFSKFDTEKDKDILYIYDGNSNNILLILSGQLKDSVYTFYTDKLKLIFITDEKNIYQGWTFTYDTDVVGITNAVHHGAGLKVYPNPVSTQLKITNYELRENTEYQIFSVVGQVVMQGQASPNPSKGGEFSIDVSHLASGMYFFKIDGKEVRFIKE